MKRLSQLGLLSIWFALPLFATGTSWVFSLPADSQIGSTHLPRGRCDVTWSATSGSQGMLIIKPEGKPPVNMLAHVIQVRHADAGVTTFVDNGVTWLQDFHTRDETFIISGNAIPPK